MQQNPNGYGPQYGYQQNGYPTPGYPPPQQPKKGLGVLGWIGIICAVLFGGCFSMCAVASKGVAEKQAEEEKSFESESATKISADELIDAYKANEVAADAKYKGKKLRVSGVLSSIDSGIGDEPNLRIGSKLFPTVTASGVSKEKAAALTKGQDIVVECKGDGEIGGMPRLTGCKLK